MNINETNKILEKLDPEKILLTSGRLFLSGEINEYKVESIIKQIEFLEIIEKKIKIILYINSSGGCVDSTLALINTIQTSQCNISTWALSDCFSGAALVFICGDRRIMSPYSSWGWHDSFGGISSDEYIQKAKVRTKHLDYLSNLMNNLIKKRTKLTSKEIEKAINTELWLTPDECLKKGVCDDIVEFSKKKSYKKRTKKRV